MLLKCVAYVNNIVHNLSVSYTYYVYVRVYRIPTKYIIYLYDSVVTNH